MTIINKIHTLNRYETSHLVEQDHGGMRLDQYIQIYLTSFSREAIKRKIEKGEIIISNRPLSKKPSSKLFHNDIVKVIFLSGTNEDEYWNGEKINLQLVPDIIFEDKDLVAISKPPFMAAHPTGKHLFNCATVYLESRPKTKVQAIHRLDRETSGILLLGKNIETTNSIASHFENNQVKKSYFFIAKIKNNPGRSFFAHERLGSKDKGLDRVYVNAFPRDSNLGKHAQTGFEILHIEKNYAIGMAYPKTGRQHQIRVHAAHHGLPLLGDKIYLGGYPMFQRFKDMVATFEDHSLMEIPRHALHAISLQLPYKNKMITFTSEIPRDLKQWISENLSINPGELEDLIHRKGNSGKNS